MKLNNNYNNLVENYLFAMIAQKVNKYQEENPEAKIIRLGIGDVTLPLPQICVDEMKNACDEMASKDTFKGYGPYEGYEFLRNAICDYYKEIGVSIENNELYVSDGAKSDIANILDIFSKENTVMIPDPVYPVYLDTNIMDGRKIVYIKANKENGFLPIPDANVKADIIYMCSPNNPTGAVYDKVKLKKWVDYANDNNAVILYDCAYEAFIKDEELPRSIFQIEGAKTCAIEFCTFSKIAGFTGTRCGYITIPKELVFEGKQLGKLWLRRQSSKYNGTAYIIQKGAAAVFSKQGRTQTKQNIDYYMNNAKLLSNFFKSVGIWHTGGTNSPYIWLECPDNMNSWDFFDKLLNEVNIVGTPGSGFGTMGEGFFRLTAFGSYENTLEAIERLKTILK
ncbi:LL-diaminopimelate aminotransferase [Eubacteriales bacterium OttesenSCG-928-G02]|nr:LL-diaminopimelate aminotransferase [Eubacteriales bacterium OttesenSCG-928-G02]